MFGDKIFEKAAGKIEDVINLVAEEHSKETESLRVTDHLDKLKDKFRTNITEKVMETAAEKYGTDISKFARRDLERKINNDANNMLNRAVGDLRIKQATLQADMEEALDTATKEEAIEIKQAFEEKKKQVVEKFKDNVSKSVEEIVRTAGEDAVRRVETDKKKG